MKKLLKALADCLFPALVYEGIAFFTGQCLWAILMGTGSLSKRGSIWIEENSGLIVTGLAGVAAAGFFLIFEKERKNREELKKKMLCKRSIAAMILLAVSSSVFFNAVLYVIPIPEIIVRPYQEAESKMFKGSIFLQAVVICLAAPLGEEGAFRGCSFSRLREEHSFAIAAVLSSLSFAIYHGNVIQGIYTFCLGLLLCLTKEVYGTMKAPLLMHTTANGVSLLLACLPDSLNLSQIAMIRLTLFSGCLMIFFTIGIAARKRWPHFIS
ncbi:type II CAAX endopeptidase family protein [Lachnospiraceae bacterium 62-35]